MSYVSPRKQTKVGKQYSSLFHKPAKTAAYWRQVRKDRQVKADAYAAAVARWEADNA